MAHTAIAFAYQLIRNKYAPIEKRNYATSTFIIVIYRELKI